MSASEWTRLLFLFPLLKPVTTSPHLLLPSPNPAIHSSLASPSFTTPPSPTTPLISTFIDTPEQEQCPLSITPPSLVVRYGDPVSANCSIMGMDFMFIGWNVPELIDEPIMGDPMVQFLVWTVKPMDKWSVRPTCFRLTDLSGQCDTQLDITVYKPPDSVSISYVNHTGPELEAQQYTLQCQVQDVAPVQNLTVTFYRGQKALGPPQSINKDEKTPVNETFSLNVTSSIEDDGAVYWCEAKLDLGPDGPQPPPVVKSNNLTATVNFGPQFLCPEKLQVREGGELTCEVRGNPSPSVTWRRDGQVVVPPTHSNREHAGKYTVSAQGARGKLDLTLEVEVITAQPTAKGTSNDCGLFLVAVLVQLTCWLGDNSY